MQELARKYRRWGSPQLHYVLRREGLVVNHKRTERIYREEKLSLRKKKRKKRPTLRVPMIPAIRPNQCWAMDFIEDRLMDGRRIKTFTLLDEYTKESLAVELGTSFNGPQVVNVLERVLAQRGWPEAIRSDNGPEFTGKALYEWIQKHNINHYLIEPGKPVQNPFIESFHDKFRNEFLNEHWFTSLPEARTLAAQWRSDYNYFRPHSSLHGLTPGEFARSFFNDQQKLAPQTPVMTGT